MYRKGGEGGVEQFIRIVVSAIDEIIKLRERRALQFYQLRAIRIDVAYTDLVYRLRLGM